MENIPQNIQQPQTASPAALPVLSFNLEEKQLICNINQRSPLIEVDVMDTGGLAVANVEVVVTWDGGEDHFFTGLQSVLGFGYIDFMMSHGVSYSAQSASGDSVESNLSAAECVAEDGSRNRGSWYSIYKQL